MEEKFGLKTKELMLNELKDKFNSSPNFFITNYAGLSSSDIEKLRKNLNSASSRYFVVKNSIAKRVLDQLKMKEFAQFITGEVGISFIGDVIKASKAVTNFSKEHPSFKLSCAFIDGKIESADRIKHIAILPSREVLIGLVLSYMKSPITAFVGVLQGLLRNLIYVINEIKNKHEKGEAK